MQSLQPPLKGVARAISTSGGGIATIAASHALALASRDTMPFRAAALQVIDPGMH